MCIGFYNVALMVGRIQYQVCITILFLTKKVRKKEAYINRYI